MTLYHELILEEYRHPRHKGRLPAPTHEARAHNPLCGDDLTVTLDVKDEVITDLKFDGHGCALSIAAASLYTDHILGRTVAEVCAMNEQDLLVLLGVTPNPQRMKCAVLIMRAVASALRCPHAQH